MGKPRVAFLLVLTVVHAKDSRQTELRQQPATPSNTSEDLQKVSENQVSWSDKPLWPSLCALVVPRRSARLACLPRRVRGHVRARYYTPLVNVSRHSIRSQNRIDHKQTGAGFRRTSAGSRAGTPPGRRGPARETQLPPRQHPEMPCSTRCFTFLSSLRGPCASPSTLCIRAFLHSKTWISIACQRVSP